VRRVKEFKTAMLEMSLFKLKLFTNKNSHRQWVFKTPDVQTTFNETI